jgi:hypothetical protein
MSVLSVLTEKKFQLPGEGSAEPFLARVPSFLKSGAVDRAPSPQTHDDFNSSQLDSNENFPHLPLLYLLCTYIVRYCPVARCSPSHHR